jgi:integrase
MIEGLQVDPRQIMEAIEGRTGSPQANSPIPSPQFSPGIFPPMSLGAVAAEDGLDLISRWVRERGPQPKSIYQARRHAIKFAAFIGHDDATRVTPEDLIDWKEDLAGKGLSAATINSHLNTIKAPLTWAHRNRKIPFNPGVGIFFDRKDENASKREGYNDDQARLILLAARDEDQPHRRWIRWLCAFTGTRLDEVAGADVRDIERGTRWVLSVRTTHRGKNGSVKNPASVRKIPLHPALIREGFLEYVNSLPNPGPLFPHLTPDRFGRRAGTATKRIGDRLRRVENETGVLLVEKPRFAPNHSWRHRFKSEARRVGMAEETSDALTGHREGKISRSYGEYYIDTVLGPAIDSMLSPFDICIVGFPTTLPASTA